MASQLENELAELCRHVRIVLSLLQRYEEEILAISELKDYYEQTCDDALVCIEMVQELIDIARVLPPAFTYATANIRLGYAGFKRLVNAGTNLDLAYVQSNHPKKLVGYDELANALHEQGVFIGRMCFSLFERSNLRATLQFFHTIPIEPGKTIRLTITYGGSQAQSNPLNRILFLSRKPDETQAFIQGLNEKLTQAVSSAFASDFFDRAFGPTFRKEVQVYIYDDFKERGLIAGCLNTIRRIFKTKTQTRKGQFVPTLEEMRFSIELNHLVNAPSSDLEATIVHELTHAYDERLTSRSDEERLVLDKIREEGLARFQEIVYEPKALLTFLPALDSEIFTRPFKNMDTLEDLDSKDIHFAYNLGLLIMLDLFWALTEEKTHTIPDVPPIPMLIGIRPQHISLNKKIALNLLNTVRLLDTKTFYAFYRKKVKAHHFTKEFLDTIDFMLEHTPVQKMNLPR